MFCGLGRFGVGTFCSWDVLELGPLVLGRFVLGRFVLGHFVGAPDISCAKKLEIQKRLTFNIFQT